MKNFPLNEIRRLSRALREEAAGKEECSIEDIKKAGELLRELAKLEIEKLKEDRAPKYRPKKKKTLATELGYPPEDFKKFNEDRTQKALDDEDGELLTMA